MNIILSRVIISILKNVVAFALLALTSAYLAVVYVAVPLGVFVASVLLIKSIFGVSHFFILVGSASILVGGVIWYVQEKIPAAYEAIRELPICLLNLGLAHGQLMDGIIFRMKYELPTEASPYSLRDSLIKQWSLEIQADKEGRSIVNGSGPSTERAVIPQPTLETPRPPSKHERQATDFDELN